MTYLNFTLCFENQNNVKQFYKGTFHKDMTMSTIICNIHWTTVTVRQPNLLNYFNKGTGVSINQKCPYFYTGLTLWHVKLNG